MKHYLKSIELENFKCFGARVHIPLAPITLIYGQNSAGKSTIIQVLNLLKQTLDFAPQGVSLLPTTDVGYVDLGSFSCMVHDHDDKLPLNIMLELEDSRRVDAEGQIPINLMHHYAFDTQADLRAIDPPHQHKYGMSFVKDNNRQKILLEKAVISLCDKRMMPECAEYPLIVDETRPSPIMTVAQSLDKCDKAYSIFHDNRARVLDGILKCMNVDILNEYDKNAPEYIELRDAHASEISFVDSDDNRASLQKDSALREKRRRTAFENLIVSPTYKKIRNRIEVKYQEDVAFYSTDFDYDSFCNRWTGIFKQYFIVDRFLPGRCHKKPSNKDITYYLYGGVDANIYLADHEVTPLSWHILSTGNGSTDNIPKVPDLSGCLSWVSNNISTLLSGYHPFAPIRAAPQRHYVLGDNSMQSVGLRGEWFANALLFDKGLVDEMNGWLEAFDIKYELKIQELVSGEKDLYILRLLDTKRKTPVEVSIQDVGYGICQLLPIIAQSLCARDQLISIEQPEVHIHPRLQAELGDLLKYCILSPRNNQFIIETHSEHLMLRIQRLMRKKKISPEDVCVLYVSRDGCGSSVQQLRLDEAGEFLDEWPSGFFEESFNEMFGRD